MRTFTYFLLLGTLTLGSTVSCGKDKQKTAVLKELYTQFEHGKITECTLNGETVYTGEINAYDAPTLIYNAQGDHIGTCNYAWGQVDAMCDELSNCTIVYCVEDNIWGETPVDKYHLQP